MSDDAQPSSSGLTFPQIAASALAAATAAILGSFLGVLGTIGGAAAASIISTVGSALYQRSLERTRDRVKERLVVTGATQQKVAGAVARVTGNQPPVGAPGRPGYPRHPDAVQPGQGLPGARGLPGAQPTRVAQQVPPMPRPGAAGPGRPPPGPGRGPAPGGPPRGPQPGAPGRPGRDRIVSTQVHPQPGAGRLPSGAIPTSRIPDARVGGSPPGGVPPTARFGQAAGGPGDGDAVTQVVVEPARRRRIGRKGWLTMAALAVSVFAIGLFASFAVETAAGHPLSGGSSGTSVGSLFGQDTGTTTPSTSDTPTTSETSSSDGSGSSEGDSTRSSRSTSSEPSTSSSRGSTRQIVPTQLVPQLGGGSDSNG